MAKIKLGTRPKSFKRVVKFPMLDGSEGAIEVTYKYRTLTEFGKFVDAWTKAANAKAQADVDQREADRKAAEEKGEDVDLAFNTVLRNAQADANADYIMNIAEGWNLDEAFELDAVRQLCDELPAAAAAVMDSYRAALTEGRLGN